jgi:hypothetical protein
MRVREENCNMVLLVTVTLFSAIVAMVATLWQEPQTVAAEANAQSEKPPLYLAAGRTPVRLVGAPFVPNLSPREH